MVSALLIHGVDETVLKKCHCRDKSRNGAPTNAIFDLAPIRFFQSDVSLFIFLSSHGPFPPHLQFLSKMLHYREVGTFILLAFFALAALVDKAAGLDIESSNIIGEYAQQSNASLLWGPYRSNLYFGIRPKGIPNSLMAGLFWYNVDDYTGMSKIRHTCDQQDNMRGYGWEQYDPRTGGLQVFHDEQEQKIELSTKFVKSRDGNSWSVRINGVPKKGHENALTTIAFYVGVEGVKKGSKLELKDKSLYNVPRGIKGDVEFEGSSSELGKFNVAVTENGGPGSPKNKYPKKSTHPAAKNILPNYSRHVSLYVPDNNVWKARDIFMTFIQDSTQKLYEKYQEDSTIPPWVVCSVDTQSHKMKGNLHFVQRVFRGKFEFDITYNSKLATNAFTSDNFEDHFEKSLQTFNKKFESAFPFQPPYTHDGSKSQVKYKEFAQELFSNLVGGIGYFEGTAVVDRSYSSEYEEDSEFFWEEAAIQLKEGSKNAIEEGPYELLTAVPSRPFFPRGFYWDEGFHLIPILEYDADLALEILKSWFALIDKDGWIAREQILGSEARSKVPKEFQTQFPHYANPPTLMLLLSNILNKFQEAQDELPDSVFENPQLHSHNRRSRKRHTHSAHSIKKDKDFADVEGNAQQVLDNAAGGGSDENSVVDNDAIINGNAHWKSGKLLKSYLKKIYPELQSHYDWFRRTQKGDIKEWGREAFSTKEGYRWRGRTPSHCLTSGLDDYPRSKTPHTGELHVDLISWIGMMTRSMRQLAEFLGKEDDASDYAEIEEAIAHNINDLHWDANSQAYCDLTIDDFEDSTFVCHKGYISLFPFLLRLISPTAEDSEEKLLAILNLIYDPEKLWTDFGIRSLSASDKYYGTGENYWRGPIWVNINYMILESLIYYHDTTNSEKVKELAETIFKELRINIVENVFNVWDKTGYAWEQYDPDNGEGKGVKHFLGWTSLTVMIMSMPETLK